MDRKDELTKEIVELREGLREIEVNERAEENQKYLGKYYKYRNSYGGDREEWWIYVRVDEIKDNGILYTSFEKTSMNYIEIKLKDYAYGHHLFENEISEREYAEAWQKQLKELTSEV